MNLKQLLDETLELMEQAKTYKVGQRVAVHSTRWRSGRDGGRKRTSLYTGKISKMGETNCCVEFERPFRVKGKTISKMTSNYSYISPINDNEKL